MTNFAKPNFRALEMLPEKGRRREFESHLRIHRKLRKFVNARWERQSKMERESLKHSAHVLLDLADIFRIELPQKAQYLHEAQYHALARKELLVTLAAMSPVRRLMFKIANRNVIRNIQYAFMHS